MAQYALILTKAEIDILVQAMGLAQKVRTHTTDSSDYIWEEVHKKVENANCFLVLG